MSADDPESGEDDAPDVDADDVDYEEAGGELEEDAMDLDEMGGLSDEADVFDEFDDDAGSEFDGMDAGDDFESLDGDSDFGSMDGGFDETFDDADGDGEFGGMEEDFDDENEFEETADGLDDEMEFDDASFGESVEVDENGEVGDAGDDPEPVDESQRDQGAATMTGDAAVDGGDGGTGSESSGPDRATVEGLEGEQLADVLSQAWVNRGWETDVAEDDDGSFFVTGDQGNGKRGLILVLPGDVEVPGKRLQQYVSLVKKKSVDVRVVATQGAFTDDAERIAKANDVHLLDPQAVLETVEAEGLEGVLSRFASENGDGSGGDEGGIGAMIPGLPGPSLGLPSGVPLPSPGGNGLKSVLVIVLIATSLLAGFAGGAFLGPGAGGGAVASAVGGLTGGGDEVAVASLSTAEPGSAGLTVHWNARTADSVVANGSSYEAPADSRFLVVQLVVENTGDDRVPVKAGDFLVNANGTRYAHQPLDGARTFEMTAVSPGNETTGWVVFAIPDDATDAVLVPDTQAAGGPVTFVRDPSLTINGTG